MPCEIRYDIRFSEQRIGVASAQQKRPAYMNRIERMKGKWKSQRLAGRSGKLKRKLHVIENGRNLR